MPKIYKKLWKMFQPSKLEKRNPIHRDHSSYQPSVLAQPESSNVLLWSSYNALTGNLGSPVQNDLLEVSLSHRRFGYSFSYITYLVSFHSPLSSFTAFPPTKMAPTRSQGASRKLELIRYYHWFFYRRSIGCWYLQVSATGLFTSRFPI